MAIVWGAWEYAGGNGMRVGLDVSWATPSHTSASAVCTIKVYTENQYTYADNGEVISYSGSIGGSTTYNNQSGGGTAVLRATLTYTYTYPSTSYGTSPGSRTFTASVSGTYNGVTPTASVTSSIPARPYAAPAAPTSVDSTRISDTSIQTTWANHATAGEPYSSLDVQIDTAVDGIWNAVVGSPGGSATSFTDSSHVGANQMYKYRVRAVNSVGSSAWVEGDIIYTTPAAPSGAARAPSGSDQVVTWTNNAYPSMSYQTEIWRAVNGTWSLLATVASGVTSYTDVAPSAASRLKYRVRHKTTGGTQGTLYSADSAETTETTGVTSAPSAPTNLSPTNSTSVNPAQTRDFTWSFNPTDGSAPSAFQIQWRKQGDTTWTVLAKTASSVSAWTAPANTFPDSSTIEWQVMTWGADAAGSPWSATATFKTASDLNSQRASKRYLMLDPTTGLIEADRPGLTAALTKYISAGTGASGANSWVPLGYFKITGQYEDQECTVVVMGWGPGNGQVYHATLRARVKQQDPFGSAPFTGLDVSELAGFKAADFKIEVSNLAATYTDGFLWARIPSSYMSLDYACIINRGWQIDASRAGILYYAGSAPGGLAGSVVGTDIRKETAAAAKAVANATQSLNTSAWTDITLQVEEYDVGSVFAGSAFVAPVAGIYHFDGTVEYAQNGSGYRHARFTKNGNPVYGRAGVAASDATKIMSINVSTDTQLAVGDTVKLQGYQTSGAALLTSYTAGDTACAFSGHLVTPV